MFYGGRSQPAARLPPAPFGGTRGTRETVALLLATLHRAPLFDSRRRARSDDTTFDVDGEVFEPQSGSGDSTHRTVPSVGQLACVLHSLLGV